MQGAQPQANPVNIHISTTPQNTSQQPYQGYAPPMQVVPSSLPPLLPASTLYRGFWNSLAYQDLAAVSNFIGAYKTTHLSRRFTMTLQQEPLTLLDVPLRSSAGSASKLSVSRIQQWHLRALACECSENGCQHPII